MKPALGAPGWLGAAAFAAIATALICYPAWPGLMSYDSLLAYEHAFTGVATMTWPPAHTYLFWISKTLGAGPGGLFAAQVFVLFLGAGAVLSMLAGSRRRALLAQAGFLAAFALVPPLLGVAMVQWRDVTTASFAVLALALWLAAARSRSLPLLVAAILAIGWTAALRYNALALFALLIPLMLARPFLGAKASRAVRAVAAVFLAATLAIAWASTVWRLPDLQRPPSAAGLGGAQLHDLFGVSACSRTNYLPPAVTGGAPITVDQIREAYEPRHLHETLRARPGLPPLYETDGGGAVAEAWGRALREQPVCYLKHRGLVMSFQVGAHPDGPAYPVHPLLDENRFGLELANPETAEAVIGYVLENSVDAWRRPVMLYLGAVIVGLLVLRRRPDLAPLFVALVGGAFAYLLPLAIAAPAADARYIFPSNVVCLIVIAGGLAALRRRTAR